MHSNKAKIGFWFSRYLKSQYHRTQFYPRNFLPHQSPNRSYGLGRIRFYLGSEGWYVSSLLKVSLAGLTQSRLYRRPSATRQSRGGRGMVGSSVVYCRRCGRAWSSVVAWFVVAFFGRLWVLKCSKLSGDHRRPKFLSSVVVCQL